MNKNINWKRCVWQNFQSSIFLLPIVLLAESLGNLKYRRILRFD